MATVTKENYLKALYFLHQKKKEISISELGEAMQVSKPTVNNMVKKLEEKGWVQYEKYRPLKLTAKGENKAALIVRKHRLSEMFLAQMMGFGWEEVHDIAEELEHIKSDHFFDRMDELMGFPTQDPHGSPIPDKEGILRRPAYKALALLKEGQSGELKALKDSSKDFLVFLNKKDIRLGSIMKVVQVESFDGSMTILVEGQKEGTITLSESVTQRLLVIES